MSVASGETLERLSCGEQQSDHTSNLDENAPQASAQSGKKRQLQGGFECVFVEESPKQVQTECAICLCVLKDPYLVDCCGNSFCQSCIKPIVEEKKPCPLCNTEFTTCILDKRLQRTLNNMKVYCSHRDAGCTWTGELGKLLQHLNNEPQSSDAEQLSGCLYVLVACSFCDENIQRQNLEEHKSNICPMRPYSCQCCNDFASTYEDVTSNHWLVCPSRCVPCPNECGVCPKLQDIDIHIDKECALTVIDCSFRYAGCLESLCRKDMQEHLTYNLAMHMSLQASSHHQEITKLQEQLKQQDELIIEQKRELEECKQQLEMLTRHVGIIPLCFIVPNFSKLKQSNGEWFSKPFYTHASGYRLCLRVFPNGCEGAKGTHVSVFVYLMKGEFDNELKWPLHGKIKILLVNHNDGNNHCSHRIKLPEHRFYRVTVGERAISGWGKSKFIYHCNLDPDFLLNDCLHFRIPSVDLFD